MKTKYYEMGVEIPLNHDNWFYVMLDSSIRTVFFKHSITLPKYVFVEKINENVTLTIVRNNLESYETAKQWKDKRIFVMDDLRIQAEANSFDDYDIGKTINYKFEII